MTGPLAALVACVVRLQGGLLLGRGHVFGGIKHRLWGHRPVKSILQSGMLCFSVQVFYQNDATILLPDIAGPRAYTAPSSAVIELLANVSIHLADYWSDACPVVQSKLPHGADALPLHIACGRDVEFGGRRDLVVV